MPLAVWAPPLFALSRHHLLAISVLIPGVQRTVECSEAARRVNAPSQIKHLRTSRPTTMNTLPIWSVRMESAPRRVCSLAVMSIRNESRTYTLVTSVLRLDSTAERQLNQQLELAAVRTLRHYHAIC